MKHLRKVENREWKGTELDNDIANGIKSYCVTKGIKIESSGCYDKTHISVYVNADEEKTINELIDYFNERKISSSLILAEYSFSIKDIDFNKWAIHKGKFFAIIAMMEDKINGNKN